MLGPVFGDLASGPLPVAVYSQDDPGFPAEIPAVVDDTSLERSFRLGIETVPTLIRVEQGREVGRAIGWHREEWRALTGLDGLGDGLPEYRPGCGSKSVDPGMEIGSAACRESVCQYV